MSFLVNITTEEELINALIELNKLGALGSEINFGTYLPDTYTVNDIIDKKICIWSEPEYDDDICAIAIGRDINEYRNKTYPNLYGKKYMHVSLVTLYDKRMGDIPKIINPYNEIIPETLKLINNK